ncbi:MAG: alkene reductase [Motiliproteus sp.]|nr:alkene reductase [Motiliproteus sp.]MCW9053563.1 alkene reductase [Motiliproteus sp.]
MSNKILFDKVDLGNGLALNNRIVMAPLTRSMADDDLVPTETMAAYYGRRADAGLIISEATIVAADGQGYPNTPGLFTDAQVNGWKGVTRRVHQNGGKMFAQLWHTGRVSHSIFHNGQPPMAPSAVEFHGRVPRFSDLEYGTPRAMTEADIERVIEDFGIAARNAKKAGFDGVEVHGANGYLIDQFLHWNTNRRDDEYGGSPEKMSRFLLRILDRISQEIDQIGIRLSPAAYIHIEHDARDKAVFNYLLEKLNNYSLAYIHSGIFADDPYDHLDGTVTQYIRRHYRGTVIASGGYDADSASEMIGRGDADLIAIGRPFIANPDYVSKVQNQQPPVAYDESMLAELV